MSKIMKSQARVGDSGVRTTRLTVKTQAQGSQESQALVYFSLTSPPLIYLKLTPFRLTLEDFPAST